MKHIFSLLLCLLIVFSCKKDDEAINTITNTIQPTKAVTDLEFQEANFGAAKTANFIGVIKDINGVQIEGVQILIGNQSTFTNHQGLFILNDVSVFEKFAFIKAIKEGYIIGSRSIIPAINGSNTIEITLLKNNTTQTVNSGEISNITLPNGIEIDFSGNFIDSNNNSYNGQVNVALNHLEPNQDATFSQMPGMLFGRRTDGSASAMETYGMLNVTLSTPNGEILNIAPDSPATLTFPISTTTPNSPESIPLWFFNETLGYWIEEGTAIKSGNEYIATVSHFTWWNVDLPINTVKGCINLNYDNADLTGFVIEIKRDQNDQIIYSGSSNNLGNLCGLIPVNETLTIKVTSRINCINGVVYEEQTGPFTTDSNIEINLTNIPSLDNTTVITGNITNCNNTPLVNGYGYIHNLTNNNNEFFIINNGQINYNFTYCTYNNYTITIKDLDTNKVSETVDLNLQSGTLNLPPITTCNTFGGVFTGSASFRTQEEVNAFGALNYHTVIGRLNFYEDNTHPTDNITTLTPLNNLNSVSGTLYFYNAPEITNLSGLENLTSVGSIIMSGVPLTTLIALNNLTTIEEDLSITGTQLTSLEGLNNLTILRHSLSLYIRSLTDISALSNLRGHIGNPSGQQIHRDGIYIGGTIALENLHGLEGITTTKRLRIERNEGLPNLEGLNNLSEVSSRVVIKDNINFTSLNGLDSLIEVEDTTSIEDNNNLTNFCALTNLVVNGNDGGLIMASNGIQMTRFKIMSGNCSQ